MASTTKASVIPKNSSHSDATVSLLFVLYHLIGVEMHPHVLQLPDVHGDVGVYAAAHHPALAVATIQSGTLL